MPGAPHTHGLVPLRPDPATRGVLPANIVAFTTPISAIIPADGLMTSPGWSGAWECRSMTTHCPRRRDEPPAAIRSAGLSSRPARK